MQTSLFLLSLLVGAPAPAPQPFAFLDPKSGAALVRGEDVLTHEGELAVRTTVVRDLAGEELFRERCVFDPRTLALVRFESTDRGAAEGKGTRQLLTVSGKRAKLVRSEGLDAPRVDLIDWTESTFPAKLLTELVDRHWATLEKGDEYAFDMFVPPMAMSFAFRLRVSARSGEERTVRAEPSSFLLRPFVPRIEFVYVRAADGTPHLKRYEGPASVELAGERQKPVVIQF